MVRDKHTTKNNLYKHSMWNVEKNDNKLWLSWGKYGLKETGPKYIHQNITTSFISKYCKLFVSSK